MDASRNDRTLRQIIAILLALAGLAERLEGRCFAVRFLVLLVLRRAEAVAFGFLARAFVVDEVGYDDDFGGGPGDAAALALRLRAIAAAFRTLLAPDGVLDGAFVLREGPLRLTQTVTPRAAAPLRAARWIHDTS
jgi:hypothetical protein